MCGASEVEPSKALSVCDGAMRCGSNFQRVMLEKVLLDSIFTGQFPRTKTSRDQDF